MNLEHFQKLRHEVWEVNRSLPKAGLVTMHSGNASGIDREQGLVLIKPSGVDYETMQPEDLALVDLDGKPVSRAPDGVESRLKPSFDTIHHLRLYLLDSKIGGIVHTHSNFATAFGTAGLPIPCVLTAIAEEFGGEIPCAPYADSKHIAESVIQARRNGPAVLLGQHGVISFHETPKKALKAAVMVEDVAKTVWIARQLSPLREIPASDIRDWHERYRGSYGQP